MNVYFLFLFLFFAGTSRSQQQQCTLADGWNPLTIKERADQADFVVDVKVVGILDPPSGSNQFSVTFELLCAMKPTGNPPPTIFTVDGFGPQGPGCPYRDVLLDQDYVVFLTKSNDDVFSLVEVNQQSAIIEVSAATFQELGDGYVGKCVINGHCPSKGPNWETQTPSQRAQYAEIVVKAKVTSIQYIGNDNNRYVAVCELECMMKQPDDLMNFPDQFNVSAYGAYSGICMEHHVDPGTDSYILFLERHYAFFPLPGATIPPEILSNYILAPQEVNFQEATFKITPDIKTEFSDYLATCGAMELIAFPLIHLVSVGIFVSFMDLF